MNTIDAVISWIDGYDPVFQEKLNHFCLSKGIIPNQAIEPTRIQQCDEITYCLHSIFRFAPWIRNIYLITNQQTPKVVTALQGTALGNKIIVVDQNELLEELKIKTPIFNSISVEWLIWQIKGLSEQFLYLNDDFFILREVTPNDFFHNDQMVLRGRWKIQAEKKYFYRIKNIILKYFNQSDMPLKMDIHRHFQEKSARLAAWHRHFYLLPHAPFPLIKQSFREYVKKHPQAIVDNLKYPFRHWDQVSSIPLIVHLSLKENKVVYDSQKHAVMVNGACHPLDKIKKRLHGVVTNPKVAFLCVQSLDQANLETQQYIKEWLKQQIL